MPEDEQYVRQVSAVVVAQRATAQATPEEATRAVEAAIASLRGSGGDAERLASDAVLGVFDTPRAAVTAATRLHLHADPTRATWHAGLYVGTVVMKAGGADTVAATERATLLAGIARPGTTAVAADDLPSLGRLRDAGWEPLPGTSAAGTVGLVVPRRPPALQDRRATLILVGAAVVGGGGALYWLANRRSNEAPHLILGVGPFRSSTAGEGPTSIGAVLRDGVETELSELSGVRVFSDDFMDFVMSREQLTTIGAAKRLGIEKMVTGTVVEIGGTVQVEARIVDIASGMLEGAYVTSGRREDFLRLQENLVLGLIDRLHLEISADDERRLAAQRTTNVDSLKRLLDAEGAGPDAASPPARPETDPQPAPEPQSRPWDRFGPSTAYADDAEAGISAFLEEYRRATEARDVATLMALYLDFPPGQRAALERFFENVRDLRVAIDRVEVVVEGEEAVVSYTRTDDFVDVPTERAQHVSVRLTKKLRRVDGRWRFVSAR